MVKIVDVVERDVPIASDISNAYVSFRTMTASTVAIVTDVVRDGKPVVGFGFGSNGRYGQGALLRDRFIPRLLRADPAELFDSAGENLDPVRAQSVLMTDEKPGGHGERSVAVGVLDMALWDAVAKIEGRPLYRVLADRFGDGSADERVYVYAAGGYYQPGKDLRALGDEMTGFLDQGYTAAKMKVGAVPLAEDLRRIETALEAVGGGDRLAVDANGRFKLRDALAFGDAIADFGLHWYEEAGDPLDYALQRALSESYPGPLATGENLFSHQDVANLLRYAGLRPDRDALQMDPVLSYGIVEYTRMLDVLRTHGWNPRRCIPHGGHQLSLHAAAAFHLGGNESYPGVFGVFGGFADDQSIEDGYVTMSDRPGIGFEGKANLYRTFLDLVPDAGP